MTDLRHATAALSQRRTEARGLRWRLSLKSRRSTTYMADAEWQNFDLVPPSFGLVFAHGLAAGRCALHRESLIEGPDARTHRGALDYQSRHTNHNPRPLVIAMLIA